MVRGPSLKKKLSELLAYHSFLLILLIVLTMNLAWNLATFWRLGATRELKRFPFVSILIPARNEEKTIGGLLESLIHQTYPSEAYEILVLDDQSEDRTLEICEDLAAREARIRVLQGKALPRGWQGKTFACQELATHARGELLLFTDADTLHEPEALASAVSELEEAQADLVTLLPRVEMVSFSEKLFLPLLHFILMAYVPLGVIQKKFFWPLAVANGQFLLFRRSAYEAIGGHATVRDHLSEDLALAREVVRKGLRLVLCDGSERLRVRMYGGLREIWAGFSKNLFSGFNYSLPLLSAALTFSLAAYIFPYLFLFGGVLQGQNFWPGLGFPLLQIFVVFLMRLLLSLRWPLGFWPIFLHPIAILLFVAIGVNSASRILSGRGAVWKGRTYPTF